MSFVWIPFSPWLYLKAAKLYFALGQNMANFFDKTERKNDTCVQVIIFLCHILLSASIFTLNYGIYWIQDVNSDTAEGSIAMRNAHNFNLSVSAISGVFWNPFLRMKNFLHGLELNTKGATPLTQK